MNLKTKVYINKKNKQMIIILSKKKLKKMKLLKFMDKKDPKFINLENISLEY